MTLIMGDPPCKHKSNNHHLQLPINQLPSIYVHITTNPFLLSTDTLHNTLWHNHDKMTGQKHDKNSFKTRDIQLALQLIISNLATATKHASTLLSHFQCLFYPSIDKNHTRTGASHVSSWFCSHPAGPYPRDQGQTTHPDQNRPFQNLTYSP